MSNSIRFAVLAAVSTETQAAEEKASIPSQIETCRKVITQYGIETAGPFILDGYSRSGYDSLSDAMGNIPPLSFAIEAAAANQYDILIVDNFDRFGDLAYMIGTRYKKLKKQIYSARQSGRVVPPAEYDPYSDDAMNIHMHVGGIIQGYRINKIRRGYNIGIPARVEAGLHPLQIPFGYEYQRRDQPAAPKPEQAAFITQLKDWLFEGYTLAEITRRANQSGTPTRRGKKWDITAVRRLLDNPYYAGLVTLGKTSAHKRRPRSQWVTKPGIHQPLWSVETHHAILAELDQRQQGRTKKTVHTLSGICVCSICGARMYRGGGKPPIRTYLSCNTWHNQHPMIEYKNALVLVAHAVARAVSEEAAHPSVNPAELYAEIKLIEQKRTLIQEGYEARIYNATEAQKKITVIEKKIDQIKRKIYEIEKGTAGREKLHQLAAQSPEKLESWIITANPAQVNRVLHAIISGITISPDQTIQKISFR